MSLGCESLIRTSYPGELSSTWWAAAEDTEAASSSSSGIGEYTEVERSTLEAVGTAAGIG